MRKKIWVHTLVKNEERYLWFSLMSVITYVDKIIIYDTGSSDNTLQIIKDIKLKYPQKIIFKEIGEVDKNQFTQVRQEMLDRSKCDWVMILDGDEVWWKNHINKAVEIINQKGDQLDTLVHHYYNLVGDIYHYQDEKAGKYKIDSEMGHLTIRFFNRKIKGLHFGNPHGTQGLFDKNCTLIQDLENTKRLHLEDRYLHFTHLIRSSNNGKDNEVMKRSIKYKYELGNKFLNSFTFPEVFYLKYPQYIPSPWKKRKLNYFSKLINSIAI